MKSVAVIQARMGSSRLPGKMMLHLEEREALSHVIHRVKEATEVDEIVVATSEKDQDLVIAKQAQKSEVSVYRGDEYDVLQRTFRAATGADAELIVRIAGDCVFTSPEIIDHMLSRLREKEFQYISNKFNRTFPFGLDVEVFTKRSFETVAANATEPHEREHVTTYYLENPEDFSVENVRSDEVFEQDRYHNRTDIELVLDEADDYFYLDKIYRSLEPGNRDIRSVIDHIDEHELASDIANVARKTKEDVEQDPRGK
jgi:spore coat polysaccharide biosynthesis protein SpsF